MENYQNKDQSVSPENENVKEGKKAIQAEELSNPKPPEVKEKDQEEDAANWRNEG